MVGAFAIAVTTYVDWQALRRGTEQTEQARLILQATEHVLSLVKDAETGQRGYLLTGDESYLTPGRAADKVMPAALAALSEAGTADPEEVGRIAQIRLLTQQKLTELAETIAVARTEGRERAIEIVKTNSGKNIMDDIRLLYAQVTQDEYRKLVERSRRLQQQGDISRSVIAVTGLVLICLLLGAERAAFRSFAKREEVVRQLDESRRLMQTTLMGIGDAVICTDERGRVTLINPVAQKLTGWSREDATGKPLETVFRIEDETSRSPRESPVTKVLREGAIVGLANHTVLVNRSGEAIPIDDSGAPIRNPEGDIAGVVLVFRDISERRLAEKAIHESEERFRAFVVALPELVWTSHANGEFEYVNPRVRGFAGWTEEQEIPRTLWSDLIHPEDRQSYLDRWTRSLESGEPFEMQCRLQRAADCVYRWFLCRAVPVHDSAGRTIRWVGTCTDIHGQMENADKLLRANEALQQSNSDLEQFAYAASHDLQEPLRMVAIYSQLLQQEYQGRLDEQARCYIGFAVNGARRMEALLKDLLFYSRVSSAPANGLETVDANHALKIALLNLEGAIRDSHAVVESRGLPELAIPELHLVQLLQNLISNAIKYRGRTAPCIRIQAQRDGLRWRFSVRDNGIGIEPQYLTQIFGVFKRLHGQEYEGTGIGLAMCQKIVERNGGHIWVESEPGKGSTFLFTLRPAGEET